MGAELAAVVFGLASAISWGGGDFFGGLATRRASVLAVLLISQGGGLLLIIVLALGFGEPVPSMASLLWGAVAGVTGMVGLGALYRGLSVGRASVVAPISAVLSAAIPALIGIVTEGPPKTVRLVGFCVALVGIWLVARSHSDDTDARSGIGLALLAGVSFGSFFVLIDQASSSGATFWPLTAARGLATLLTGLTLLVRRQEFVLHAATTWSALLAGALDASGNALFVLATQAGRLDVAAVLSSLYPASTVLLARAVLGEKVSWVQSAGVLLALAAVALIAA